MLVGVQNTIVGYTICDAMHIRWRGWPANYFSYSVAPPAAPGSEEKKMVTKIGEKKMAGKKDGH